jgi:SAM-dependent methyltransferase
VGTLNRLAVKAADPLVTALKWLRSKAGFASTDRSAGLRSEIAFWDKVLRTGGWRWREDHRRRLDPAAPLQGWIAQMVDPLPGEELRILDVGAGPLTNLGKTHPTRRLHITATDVLAHEYDALLEKYRISPPVRSVYAEAERLSEVFGENAFDVVVATNSIDHTRDPVEAIRQMIRVAKPGRMVLLDHAENEADHEGYQGLHQWNFSVEDGRFVLRNRERVPVDVGETFAALAEIRCTREQRRVKVQLLKK